MKNLLLSFFRLALLLGLATSPALADNKAEYKVEVEIFDPQGNSLGKFTQVAPTGKFNSKKHRINFNGKDKEFAINAKFEKNDSNKSLEIVKVAVSCLATQQLYWSEIRVQNQDTAEGKMQEWAGIGKPMKIIATYKIKLIKVG